MRILSLIALLAVVAGPGRADDQAASAPARRRGARPAAQSKARRPSAPKERSSSEAVGKRLDDVERMIGQGRFHAARIELESIFEAMSESDPNSLRYYEKLGRISRLEGSLSEAKSAWMAGVKKAQQMRNRTGVVAELYADLGSCLLAEKDGNHAAQAFERGLESNPSDETRHRLLLSLQEIREKPSL